MMDDCAAEVCKELEVERTEYGKDLLGLRGKVDLGGSSMSFTVKRGG